MTTKKTVPVAQTEEVTATTPAEYAAKAGFTNWATITRLDEDNLLLITADGDRDLLTIGVERTERVLASYEAVYTKDSQVPTHPRITIITEVTP